MDLGLSTIYVSQFEPEFCALTDFGLKTHLSTHAFHRLSHDGEPDACAFIIPRGMDALEHGEDSVLVGGCDADAFILKPDANPGSVLVLDTLLFGFGLWGHGSFFGPDFDMGSLTGPNKFDRVG